MFSLCQQLKREEYSKQDGYWLGKLNTPLGLWSFRECHVEAIQVLFVRRNDDVGQTLCQAWIVEGLMPFQIGLSIGFVQRYGQREVWRRDVPDDDLLWRRFEKDTIVWVVLTIRPVHYKLPPAVGLELKYLECIAETVRPPPSREPISIDKRGEDFRWREWEVAAR
jgi:hypothetical protein